MDKRTKRIRKPASTKASKQRKFRYTAPAHVRRKMVSSRVSEHLRYPDGDVSAIPLYPRSMPVRKGDKVRVVQGGDRGREGKITKVNLTTMKVEVEGCTYLKADQTSIPRPIDPSNITIIHLDMNDKMRQKMVNRAYVTKKSLVDKTQEKLKQGVVKP